MKRRNYIPYLLLLSFLLILMHSFIPHHHHDEALVFHAVEQCADKDHHDDESSEVPLFCYMICDLSFYSGEAFIHVRPLELISLDFFAAGRQTVSLKDEPAEFIFIPLKFPHTSSRYFSVPSLRGPPFFYNG